MMHVTALEALGQRPLKHLPRLHHGTQATPESNLHLQQAQLETLEALVLKSQPPSSPLVPDHPNKLPRFRNLRRIPLTLSLGASSWRRRPWERHL